MEGSGVRSGAVKILMDPDPDGPKHKMILIRLRNTVANKPTNTTLIKKIFRKDLQ
jgi:hypothetical protein